MTQAPSFWRCSECEREFRLENQWHSCVRRSVEDHFEGKPEEVRRTFVRLVGELERLGPIRVDAVKSGINIAGRAHFAGARPQKDGLRVGFLLGRRLEHPRVLRAEWVGGRVYAHSVKLAREEDLDELLGWLAEAYELKGRPLPP